MTELAYDRSNGLDVSLPWSLRHTPRIAAFPGDRNAESFVPHAGRDRALDVSGFRVDYRIRRVA